MWLIINYLIFITVVGYFAFRLGHNVMIFVIISILFSPIIGFLFLAIWDYYQNFIKGKV